MHNLLRKPDTRRYPKERPVIPDKFRGKHVYKKEKCTYCCLCVNFCPSGAIKVNRVRKTWQVDLGRCLFCDQCAEVCPTKAIELGKEYELASEDKKDFVLRC
jgi:formate hydrogenlyase subunit 6/NADH:ubiquinone oxidoreductase subunit I